ncbi:MAG: hypothetical protein ACK4ND_15265 [Cytophagaceae bacterium]
MKQSKSIIRSFLILVIFFFLLTGFNYISPNPYVPQNLRTSEIIIIKRDFSAWIKTIDTLPNGYDSYAQKSMFDKYETTIVNIVELFEEKNINYLIVIIPDSTEPPILD